MLNARCSMLDGPRSLRTHLVSSERLCQKKSNTYSKMGGGVEDYPKADIVLIGFGGSAPAPVRQFFFLFMAVGRLLVKSYTHPFMSSPPGFTVLDELPFVPIPNQLLCSTGIRIGPTSRPRLWLQNHPSHSISKHWVRASQGPISHLPRQYSLLLIHRQYQ